MDLFDIWDLQGVLTSFDVSDILTVILRGDPIYVEEEELLIVPL